jgi:outer membrane usher protein
MFPCHLFSGLSRNLARLLLFAGISQCTHMAQAVEAARALHADAVPAHQLYLQVLVNGNLVSDLQPFTQRQDGLWVDPAVLRKIGFRSNAQDEGMIRLQSLADTQVNYDVANQTVAIIAPLSALNLSSTVLSVANDTPPEPSMGSGMLLNYDLYSTYDPKGSSSLSAATEVRAFNSLGVLSNTMLSTYSGSSQSSSGIAYGRSRAMHTTRLDSTWTRSWPDKEISLTVGDTTTSSLSWTRPTRVGGIRLGRNFSLQPYKITSPLPEFMGTAAMPSAVDLYIDGIKRYNGSVPAGPFELNGMPTLNGMGNAQIVLTDMLGRRTQIEIPFYASSQMLAAGLLDWSVETGYVRKDYGWSSFSYGNEPMASGTLRYGASNSLTLETHAESTRGGRSAGVGAIAALGLAGQLSGSYALSQSGDLRGAQYSLGYRWRGRRFNVGANAVRADSSYRDIAWLNGASPPARASESAVMGVSLNQLGAVNLSYVKTRYPGQPANRYAGAHWSKSLGGVAMLTVSYNRNLQVPHDQSVYMGISFFLDRGLTVSASVQRSDGDLRYGAAASQTATGHTGWNWSVRGQQSSNSKYGYAEAAYRGQHGEYRAGFSESDASSSAFAGASGSVVLMGGGAFTGRKVQDGFAVVSTSGIPDVPVKLQNNPVGRTGSNGMLMISPLGAYQKNQIAIDTLSLPLNMKIDKVHAEVATPAGAGALVTFDIAPIRAAAVIVQDKAGKPLALGAAVSLNGAENASVVGYDGVVYLENLRDRNVLEVSVAGHSCTVEFDYRDGDDPAFSIGPLLCE